MVMTASTPIYEPSNEYHTLNDEIDIEKTTHKHNQPESIQANLFQLSNNNNSKNINNTILITLIGNV